MRLPSPYVLGVISVAGTIGTAAAAALGVLPRAAWIALLVLAVALFVGAIALHVRNGPQSVDAGPRDHLKERLAGVDAVRTWLSLRDDPNEPLPLDEDRVFQWAKATYDLIKREFPAEADAFMGQQHAPLGSGYFATAYALRSEQTGRREYLETRAGIVREILRQDV